MWLIVIVVGIFIVCVHGRQETEELSFFEGCMNTQQLSKQHLVELLDQRHPFLLCNPFEQKIGADAWIGSVYDRLSDESVQYDNRILQPDDVEDAIETYECSLAEFISIFKTESDHEDAVYLLTESLLSEQKDLTDVFTLNTSLFERDRFLEFPESYRPKQGLLISGRGGRSFLHRDPFSWTGWNYLLQGLSFILHSY